MKPQTASGIFRSLVAAAAVSLPMSAAFGQAPTRPADRIGLAAALADDDKLLSELSRRELDGLCEYMFAKLKVPADQQVIIKAVASLKRLDDPNLAPAQKQQLVRSIALGIDRVLLVVQDPGELMRLAAALVENGSKGGLNLLEYWGEDTRIQAQVRPLADAVAKTYARAIKLASERKDRLEGQMTTPALQAQLGGQWENAAKMIVAGKYNAPFNLYALALSMDKADARRQKVCDEGIEMMREFEDPQYEVGPVAAVCVAKLQMAKRTPDGIEAARKKFAEVLKDKTAAWPQKFEAVYFTAVADALGEDVAAARKGMATAAEWLRANPAPDDTLKKGTDAAMKMLNYRIYTIEAEKASGEDARKANQAAIGVLQDLLKDRPDLEPIINQQMLARLPDQPDVTAINALLLRAMAARGSDEISKQNPDKKVLAQAVSACREIVRRVGKEGITPRDAGDYLLRQAVFCDRLGQDLEAASLYLKHVETYRTDLKLANEVLDSARMVVGRLMQSQKNGDAAARATQELYARYLDVATAAPFQRKEHNFEYGVFLMRRNASLMEGNFEARRAAMLADAKKAVALFQMVSDEKQKLQAKTFELAAMDQVLDLNKDPQQAKEAIARVQALADEINGIIQAEMPRATDDAAKLSLKRNRVRTLLVAANLAEHLQGEQRAQSLERAIALLANIEQDVDGLPNSNALLSEALLIRLQALMELNRTDEAMQNLGKFLGGRSDEQGLQVVIRMIETLGNEFDQAQQQNNKDRMAQLAAYRARVSQYLVDRAASSTREETRKLLPRYKMFQASSLQKAAELASDAAARKKYLTDALVIYDAALKETPDDWSVRLSQAMAQYDLGDYAHAQKTLADLMAKHLLGKPVVITATPEGDQIKPNPQYWNGMIRLLRSNVALVKANAPGFDQKVMAETQRMLKQLYITWGQPGGPKFAEQFEQLRQEIAPDWTPPPLDGEATTQPGK